MTDEEGSNLTPARPIAPRRRIGTNTQMAQPVRDPQPEPADPQPLENALPAALTAEPVGADYVPPVADADEAAIEEREEAEAESEAAVQEAEIEADAEAEADVAADETGPPALMSEPLASIPAPPAAPQSARPAPKAVPAPSREPVQAPAPVPAPPSAAAPAPAPAAQPAAPEPAPAAATASEPPADQPEMDFPKTIRDTLSKVDAAWGSFRAIAMRYPSERMDERLGEDAWTVKQMLEHVAAWHDLTADRMIKFINTGKSAPLDRDTDRFNAGVARQAIGKTSGEVLKDMDATFNRLRRQIARLSDVQLAQDEWWAAWVIGGNTYGHYEEHWAEIFTPDLAPGSRNRR